MQNNLSTAMEKKAHLPTIHLAILGHVEHGKSTLAGRVLYELGFVSEDTILEYKQQSRLAGKPTNEFAWVVDKSMPSREIGNTLSPSFQLIEFDEKRVVLIDSPGHFRFTKSAILAAAEADAVILVVAADDGIMRQTKEHAVFCFAFGIRDLTVVINKMDKTSPPYSEERYLELSAETTTMLEGIGFELQNIQTIPVAAYPGRNISKLSNDMDWYQGMSFTEMLQQAPLPEGHRDLPFRLPIDHTFPKKGIGQIILGKVRTGKVSIGESCVIMPGNLNVRIRSIESFNVPISDAMAGDDIGIGLSKVRRFEIQRGMVIGGINPPPQLSTKISAKITLLDEKSGLVVGRKPLLFAHSISTQAEIQGIISKVDSRNGNVIKRKPEKLTAHETGFVEMLLSPAIVLEERKSNPRLSKFILREHDRTVALGSCIEIIS